MKDQLVSRSAESALAAIDGYLAKEAKEFVLSAACAQELLAKALLASFHPALIVAFSRDELDSLYWACGAKKLVGSKVRTIGASEAFSRCIKLKPALAGHKAAVSHLSELRNQVVHMGEPVQIAADVTSEDFSRFLAATTALLEAVGADREVYFGKHSKIVSTLLDETLEAIKKVVSEKVASAKAYFADKYGHLDEKLMGLLVDAVTSGQNLAKFEEQTANCPACGHPGTVQGFCEHEWVPQADVAGEPVYGEPPSLVVTLHAEAFHCPFCNLQLDGSEELEAAGVGPDIEIEDPDPNFYQDDAYDDWL